jgi:hypothetical protein
MGSTKVNDFLKRFRKTFLIIGILYVLDVFVLNQGIIVTFIGAFAILGGFFRMIWALIRRRWDIALERLVRIVLYALLISLTLASVDLLNKLANRKMQVIVAAVEAYKGKYGTYPEMLERLVPEFLKAVPVAKPAVLSSSFCFTSQPQRHYLWYQTSPMGNHEYYDFDRKKWGYYQVDRDPPARDYDRGQVR